MFLLRSLVFLSLSNKMSKCWGNYVYGTESSASSLQLTNSPLWNLKIHCRSPIRAYHGPICCTSYCLSFRNPLSCYLSPPPDVFPWSFPVKVCMHFLFSHAYPAHLILLGLVTLIIVGAAYKLWCFWSVFSSFLLLPSSILGPYTLLNPLVLYTLNLCCSIIVKD